VFAVQIIKISAKAADAVPDLWTKKLAGAVVEQTFLCPSQHKTGFGLLLQIPNFMKIALMKSAASSQGRAECVVFCG